MPRLGEIKLAREIGYTGRGRHIWDACPVCGIERWQSLRNKGTLCRSCAARKQARERQPITFSGVGTPVLGDVATTKSLGYSGRGIMLYLACPSCGVARWVRRSTIDTICVHCVPKLYGKENPKWSGGKKTKRGYTFTKIGKNDPMFVMADRNGWVLEHRLIVARRIGRPLVRGEVVHHINGVKPDNSDSNLQLLSERTHSSHLVMTKLQQRVCLLENRLTIMEAENTRLEAMVAKLIPSQAEEGNLSLGVCRDWTGDTPQLEGEGTVHPLGKPRDNDA